MFKQFVLALPLAAVLLCSTPLRAWAQAGSAAFGTRADPADAGSPVARAVYQSSFTGYRRFAEQSVNDWRESNDNVGRIGGWRAYAREAQEAKPAVKIPAVPVPSGDTPDAHQQLH